MALLLIALLTLPTALAAVGLPALRQGGGARAAGLAGAETALFAAQALNPAARQSRGRSVAFNHQASIQHIRQNHLHLTQARGRGTWGLSAQLWQANDLERRTGPSAKPLGHFGVYEGAVGLSYARQMEQTRLGLQLKFIHQAIFTQNASGLAADLGLMRDISASLRLGATVRNLGRMNRLDQRETDLPLEARFGAAYVGRADLLVAVEAQKVRGDDLTLHLGGEYRGGEHLRLRAGYQTTENRSLSAGVGLAAKQWVIDYAYVPFGSGLGDAHWLSLQLESATP
ncbi:MAG: PorV/PorQ family protein [Gemmatimonadetes bacterium]|nr:PorV/PorQ family protein [Gemmatimonadota bacterium]